MRGRLREVSAPRPVPPSAALPATPGSAAALRVKRVIDVTGAAAGLIMLTPVFLVLAVLIRASSRGPVVLRQRRVGMNGAVFEMVKFRTMVATAEADGRPVWCAKNDERVTPVGRVLRAHHLDELPQLWNVLIGQMSLIGPRPERPEISAVLAVEIPQWQQRHCVRPGMTGWAQLRSGYAASIDESRLKLTHDLYYLRHRCLRLDLEILAETVGLDLHRRV